MITFDLSVVKETNIKGVDRLLKALGLQRIKPVAVTVRGDDKVYHRVFDTSKRMRQIVMDLQTTGSGGTVSITFWTLFEEDNDDK